MDDISPTLLAKSDQLNAADLVGGSITVKIIDVKVSPMIDQPVSINIGDDFQPYKPCKTMRRLLANLWGTSSKEWIGQSVTLFCDPEVMWAGQKAGGIRVSHATGIATKREIPLRSSKHKVTTYTILPLRVDKPYYSDDDFNKNKASWKKAIDEDKTTSKRIIEKISDKFKLTSEQEIELLNL